MRLDRRTFLAGGLVAGIAGAGMLGVGGGIRTQAAERTTESAAMSRTTAKSAPKAPGSVDGDAAYFGNLFASGLTSCIQVAGRKDGRTIFEYCDGVAIPSDPQSAKLTPATQLNVASVTKTVTGALLCRLVEEGELVLEDKVQRFVPEYPFDDVCVLNLMTHTAGYGPEQARGIGRPATVEKVPEYLKALYAIKTRPNKPWEAAPYFSPGYTMVMDIIQRIAGQPIGAFARHILFEPCGMTCTSYDYADVPRDQFIPPWNGKNLGEKLYTMPPLGDTGLLTTADDLVKFGEMLLAGGASGGRRVYAEACVAAMLRECTQGRFNKTPIFFYKGEHDNYHMFGDLTSPRAAGHTGSNGCAFMVDPQSGVTAAVLTNNPKMQAEWHNYGRVFNRVLSRA